MANDLYDGATDPIWFGDRKVWSVTGFALGVRRRVSELPSMWVQGELSDFKHLKHLSMVYFTLKDPENGYRLNCTIGRTRFEQLRIQLADGERVQVFGRPDIYAPHGVFQLRVQAIEHVGRGMLMQQLEALKARLADEGLFDESRKRSLPFLPRRVGVITGADAAAQGDFLRNVAERFPPVKLVMVETLVQGERAAPLLLAALRKLERIEDVDVIVITRGGGAFEHFLPFSDERLCRAIAACPKPVVSAIGHEKDSPLSDYVADLRVSTPTAAARTVVPDHAQIVERLARQRRAVRGRTTDRVRQRGAWQDALRARLTNRTPMRIVEDRRGFIAQLRARSLASTHAAVHKRRHRLAVVSQRLDVLPVRVERARTALDRDGRSLRQAAGVQVAACAARQREVVGRLRALSPSATLERGYAIVRRAIDGTILRSSQDAVVGERVTMTLARGHLTAAVDGATDGEESA